MTAYIATLEGDYSRSYKHTGRQYKDPRFTGETMAGWGFIKSIGNVIMAPVKGASHAVMEVGRGIKSGDLKKILKAPFKGVGHTIGETYRGTTDHLEYYWRPSKMGWMKPVGSGLMMAAPFTGPAMPLMMAGGAALTLGGSIGGKVHQTHLERQAVRAQNTPEAKAARAKASKQKADNQKWMYIGGAALLGGVALMAVL